MIGDTLNTVLGGDRAGWRVSGLGQEAQKFSASPWNQPTVSSRLTTLALIDPEARAGQRTRGGQQHWPKKMPNYIRRCKAMLSPPHFPPGPEHVGTYAYFVVDQKREKKEEREVERKEKRENRREREGREK